MNHPAPQPNSQEARLEGFLRAAVRAGLTVYGVEVRKGGLRILTQPSDAAEPASESDEDSVARWLRENP